MIWEWHAPSHWVCKDFTGYEIHMRAQLRRGAKTILDKIKESWIVEIETKNKIKHFKNQPHINEASDKAVAYLRKMGKRPELEIILEKERLERQKREIEAEAARIAEEEFSKYRKYTDFSQ